MNAKRQVQTLISDAFEMEVNVGDLMRLECRPPLSRVPQ